MILLDDYYNTKIPIDEVFIIPDTTENKTIHTDELGLYSLERPYVSYLPEGMDYWIPKPYALMVLTNNIGQLDQTCYTAMCLANDSSYTINYNGMIIKMLYSVNSFLVDKTEHTFFESLRKFAFNCPIQSKIKPLEVGQRFRKKPLTKKRYLKNRTNSTYAFGKEYEEDPCLIVYVNNRFAIVRIDCFRRGSFNHSVFGLIPNDKLLISSFMEEYKVFESKGIW